MAIILTQGVQLDNTGIWGLHLNVKIPDIYMYMGVHKYQCLYLLYMCVYV